MPPEQARLAAAQPPLELRAEVPFLKVRRDEPAAVRFRFMLMRTSTLRGRSIAGH